MNSKLLSSSLALLLCGMAAVRAADVDGQARLGFSGRTDLGNGFRLELATEQRFKNDLGTYYYGEYDIGVSFKVTDWLAVAPTFRLAETRKSSQDKWVHEYRPMLNVTLSQTFGGWKFEDRNRIEWRNYDDPKNADDIVRYRNRLKITAPWQWTRFKITPYGSVEIFQDCNGEKTALQNYEVVIGVDAALTDAMSLSLYYMAEFKEDADKHSTPHTANIAGAALKVTF